MSRHVSAAGTRFRLLNCGMSLLQGNCSFSTFILNINDVPSGDVMPKSLAKHVLRQRIYSCCLDFFCNDKMYPNRTGTSLIEDVQVSQSSVELISIACFFTVPSILLLGHA